VWVSKWRSATNTQTRREGTATIAQRENYESSIKNTQKYAKNERESCCNYPNDTNIPIVCSALMANKLVRSQTSPACLTTTFGISTIRANRHELAPNKRSNSPPAHPLGRSGMACTAVAARRHAPSHSLLHVLPLSSPRRGPAGSSRASTVARRWWSESRPAPRRGTGRSTGRPAQSDGRGGEGG